MDLEPGRVPEITDADVAEASGRVRWLLVQFLEEWQGIIRRQVQDAIDAERPVDPRMLELGLRAAKQLGDMYRLARPAIVAEEEPDVEAAVMDHRALVEDQLRSIEERMQSAGQ